LFSGLCKVRKVDVPVGCVQKPLIGSEDVAHFLGRKGGRFTQGSAASPGFPQCLL